jgi:hypothetical protein
LTTKSSFDPENNKALAVAKSSDSDFHNIITKRGLLYFLKVCLRQERSYWYAAAQPGMRKKFGLHTKSKKRLTAGCLKEGSDLSFSFIEIRANSSFCL